MRATNGTMKIVTIAIGEAHLKMAYMLAASVYGKHKMWIITDQPIEHGFLFEKVLKPFVIGSTNYETALRNKFMLDKVAPCLFMDADSLLFKKVDFNDLQQFESISLPERTPYPAWVDVEKVKSIYGLRKYWRHNTSWMYLDGGNMSKWIFQKARAVYEDLKNGIIENKEFHGTINDEPCIDIAVSYAIGQFKVPYKVNVPLYLPFFKFEGSHHTVNSYYGISIAGKTKNMDAVNFYNSWVEYFAKAVGIEPHYFDKLKPVRVEKGMPRTRSANVAIFYHIAMIGNWEEVVKEQLAMMHMSGLCDKGVSIGCVGSEENKEKLDAIIRDNPHVFIEVWEQDINKFEFPTLRLLQAYCNENPEGYVLYLHTKGVNLQSARHWRAYMNHFCITLWKNCIKHLKDGYDSCGVKYIDETSGFPRHYSGNFWWAYAGHINTLPSVDSLNLKDRYEAEMWLCKNPHPVMNMSDVFIDYIRVPNFV